MSLYCKYESLETESDVEQKFIYPFLTSSPPMGLGLDDSQILTKKRLRQVAINKGKSKKLYYPDYLISIRGIPILILEAKKPKENLDEAYAEARLYATEVNAQFPHNVNVCQYIVVSNGDETWAGYSDDAIPHIKLTFEDFSIENELFASLLSFCGKTQLETLANEPYVKSRGKSFFHTPISQLGGRRTQNAELEENSFGRTFIFENRRVFDPETEEDRSNIVENAYILSSKREQHIDPIYKEIRKYEVPNQSNATPLPTKTPIELVQRISQRVEDRNELYSLLLLIGNVGSGKTTFVRYFKKVFLEKEHKQLAEKCDWVFVNMNLSPLAHDEIYSWLKNQIIYQLKNNHPEVDFDSIETIKKVFHKDVAAFDKGLGSLLKSDVISYNKELYNLLNEKLQDTTIYLSSLISYFKDQRGMLPIIVLDNCDKRTKDEQLLMFQVSQWLRSTFKCLIILPMRDTTYDQYKDVAPLDTVVKDLVFRIDPPDLLKVLQARLDYIVRITNQTDTTYVLKNGMNVTIKKSELIEYFKCILMAIRGNNLASDVFYRLSDRNTRKGIQLFEDFCKSGHILSEDIFAIRTVGQDYQLPTYKFLNAVLRKNRKYYNGEHSNFVNLFFANYADDFPDPFVRVDILRWLNDHYNTEGPSNVKGMFPVREILRDMQIIGHDMNVSSRELNYMLKRDLLICESLSDNAACEDLVKITIPGKLHLRLLNNVTYLAACAEDSIFKNTEIMMSISKRIASPNHLSKLSLVVTAKEFISYLNEYRTEFCSLPKAYISDDFVGEIYDLHECQNAIDRWMEKDLYIAKQVYSIEKYKPRACVAIEVVSKSTSFMLCEFCEDREVVGYLSVTDEKYNLSMETLNDIEEGDTLTAQILGYNYTHKKFELRYEGQ